MATTIKVSEPTRDRIRAIGSSTGESADAVVAAALTEYERALFWRAFAAAAERAAPDPDAPLWDRTLRDGLEGA